MGFTTRQAQKDKFMAARAVSSFTCPARSPKPRSPSIITDNRFEKSRALRRTCGDDCGEFKVGNEAGAFYYRENMPLAGERKAAWERGEWNATWYCVDCYKKYYGWSHLEACERLGFRDRAVRKAWYTF